MPERTPWRPAGAAAAASALVLLATPGGPTARAEEGSGFVEVRRMLLGAAGPEAHVRPRVWTHPTPVENDAPYHVRFEAQCDCQALLFAVDGTSDEIALLYPNPHEKPRRLVPGEVLEIPSSDRYTLRAVGGGGLDILKLFVTRGRFGFPEATLETWRATPAEPAAVAELARFLRGLEGTHWATAAAPLQIVQ